MSVASARSDDSTRVLGELEAFVVREVSECREGRNDVGRARFVEATVETTRTQRRYGGAGGGARNFSTMVIRPSLRWGAYDET